MDDVPGLGDRAFKVANQFYVIKDGVYLTADTGLNVDGSPESMAALRTLTEKAVSRL